MILVEGFNNIVPLSIYINYSDLILVVAPGKIAVIDPIEFLDAFHIINAEFAPISKYLDLLKPKKIISVPFNPNRCDWERIISEFEIFNQNHIKIL